MSASLKVGLTVRGTKITLFGMFHGLIDSMNRFTGSFQRWVKAFNLLKGRNQQC